MIGVAVCHTRCWAFIVLCWASAPSSGDVMARGAQRRDSSRPPAIAKLDATEDLFAIGDARRDYKRLTGLPFVARRLESPDRTKQAEWSGATVVLTCTGDLIDRGRIGDVLELLRALRVSAEMQRVGDLIRNY